MTREQRKKEERKNTETYLKHAADGIEKPPVTVDLLGVLLLEDKDYLYGHQIVWVVVMWKDKSWRRVDAELSCVLTKSIEPTSQPEYSISICIK